METARYCTRQLAEARHTLHQEMLTSMPRQRPERPHSQMSQAQAKVTTKQRQFDRGEDRLPDASSQGSLGAGSLAISAIRSLCRQLCPLGCHLVGHSVPAMAGQLGYLYYQQRQDTGPGRRKHSCLCQLVSQWLFVKYNHSESGRIAAPSLR